MIQRLHRSASALLTVFFGLSACHAPEVLLRSPTANDDAVVAPYNTQTYLAPLNDFQPLNVGQTAVDQGRSPRTRSLVVLVDERDIPSTTRETRYGDTYSEAISQRLLATLPVEWVNDPDHELTLYRFNGRNLSTGNGSKTSTATNDFNTAVLLTQQGVAPTPRATIIISHWRELDKLSTGSLACTYLIGAGGRYSRFNPSDTSDCGFATPSDRLSTPAGMAHFVEQVLFKPPIDDDGDGIYDYKDDCPDTPTGRLVNFRGCLMFDASVGQHGARRMGSVEANNLMKSGGGHDHG